MYYTWRSERINVKVVMWGASDVGKTSTVHGLAGKISEMVEAGEAEPPGPEKAVGMRRNHQPVEVDEPERKLTVYFCHPPGRAGQFEGHELHYKWVVPEGRPEENGAYDGVFDGVSALVLTLDARRDQQEANREAIERLAGHLQRRYEVSAATTSGVISEVVGSDGEEDAMPLVLQVHRAESESALGAKQLVETLRLPDEHVVVTKGVGGEDVWPLMPSVRQALEPHLQAAMARGAIPASNG